MKRKMKFLVVLFIGLILIPIIKAENVIKEKANRTYVFETVDFMCPEANGEYGFSDFYGDEAILYNMSVSEAPFYKKDMASGECSMMTPLEERDYRMFERKNRKDISYEWDNQNKIYRVESSHVDWFYSKTDDTEIDINKVYYIYEGPEHFSQIFSPSVEDISTYYENKAYVAYSSFDIDDALTYYKLEDSNDWIISVVSSPVSEDVLEYYVLFEESKHLTKTYILTADFDIFDSKNLEKQQLHNIIEVEGEKYLAFNVYDDEAEELYYILYTASGEVLKDKESNEPLKFEYIGNIFESDIMIVELSDDNVKLVTPNFNIIDTFEGYSFVIMKAEDNYAYIVKHSMISSSVYYKITMYELDEGANQTFGDNNLTFKFNGDLNRLSNVKINGTDLESDNYTTLSGSTIITLKKDYLDTLKSGTYTLTVEYDDGGYSSVAFTVGENNPQTFDGIMTQTLIGLISMIGVAALTIYSKKKKLN